MNSSLSTPAKPKITAFTDLMAWQEGHKLVLMIYEATKNIPQEERFGLIAQLRDAAVSVTSNIAEGFRRTTGEDKSKFYTIALGSLTEIENQILISKDVGYMSPQLWKELRDQTWTVSKLTHALARKTRTWD